MTRTQLLFCMSLPYIGMYVPLFLFCFSSTVYCHHTSDKIRSSASRHEHQSIASINDIKGLGFMDPDNDTSGQI
jgi:hypothetical protein